jgi:hypothetical protein
LRTMSKKEMIKRVKRYKRWDDLLGSLRFDADRDKDDKFEEWAESMDWAYSSEDVGRKETVWEAELLLRLERIEQTQDHLKKLYRVYFEEKFRRSVRLREFQQKIVDLKLGPRRQEFINRRLKREKAKWRRFRESSES